MSKIFADRFVKSAIADIKGFATVLNETPGICHSVPLKDLLNCFEMESKFN